MIIPAKRFKPIYMAGVSVCLVSAIAMPLLALFLLWITPGLSLAIIPVAFAFIMSIWTFKKLAPPPFSNSNHANRPLRIAIFTVVILAAIGLAALFATHPPRTL